MQYGVLQCIKCKQNKNKNMLLCTVAKCNDDKQENILNKYWSQSQLKYESNRYSTHFALKISLLIMLFYPVLKIFFLLCNTCKEKKTKAWFLKRDATPKTDFKM